MVTQNALLPPSLHYQSYLREAVRHIRDNINFGRSLKGHTEENQKFDFTFGDEIKEEDKGRFDKELWEVALRHTWGLELKPGVEGGPASAIKSMFDINRASEWTLDCAEFVQAVHLRALQRTLGEGPFNKRVQREGPTFFFADHGSTGLRSWIRYERKRPTERMVRSFNGTVAAHTADELVRIAPMGSRVEWTNLKGSGEYRNENTIKMGHNQFAAHGIGAKKKYPSGIFSRAEVEKLLAAIALGREPDADYLRKNIFISGVEFYDTRP